jgi:hypothetical protein
VRCAVPACNHCNLDISASSPKLWKPPLSAWSCRSQQQLSGQQRPRDFRLRPQSQRMALSSVPPAVPVTHTNISKRPSRSRRRPFRVPSPCRKNEQENCRFPWDWQPRRPSASPPAAGKLARSSVAQHFVECAPTRTLARPNPPPAHPSIVPPLR